MQLCNSFAAIDKTGNILSYVMIEEQSITDTLKSKKRKTKPNKKTCTKAHVQQ